LTEDKTFAHTDDNLLVKDGPHVVITFDDDQFTGCYADVPMFVSFLTQGPDLGEPPACVSHYVRGLEALNDIHKKPLDKKRVKWQTTFGQWDLVDNRVPEPKPKPKPEVAVEEPRTFLLDNLLTVSALSTELIKAAHPFAIKKLNDRQWQFEVTEKTLDYIRRYCEEVL
jgi:hypothetical protein